MEKRHRRTHFGGHPQSGLWCSPSALALCPPLYKFIRGATKLRCAPALPNTATGWFCFGGGVLFLGLF